MHETVRIFLLGPFMRKRNLFSFLRGFSEFRSMESNLLQKNLIGWVGVAGLAVGFAGGYLVPRENDVGLAKKDTPKPPAASQNPREIPIASEARRENLPALPRAEAARQIYRALPAIDVSSKSPQSSRYEWVRNLTPTDIPLFIEGLCAARSGPQGMEFGEQRLITEALQTWWEADRNAVIGWVKGLPPGPVKRFLLSQVLENFVIDSNPALASRLAKEFHASDPDWDFDGFNDAYFRKTIDSAWKNPASTAEEMLQLYSQLPVERNKTNCGPVTDYPENFDFRKFLDGLSMLIESNKKPSRMPSDALRVWAMEDPQAAAAWLIKNSERENAKIPFNDWSSISEAVSSVHGPQAYHEWAAKVLASAPDRFVEKIFYTAEGGEVMGIVSATPIPAVRDRVLLHALGGSDIQTSIRYLEMMSSPAVRLDAISANKYKFVEANREFEFDDSVFRNLGITREQVAAVLEAGD